MRALIIEDDVDLREQIAAQLRKEGFAVDATGDGEEGLFFAEEYPTPYHKEGRGKTVSGSKEVQGSMFNENKKENQHEQKRSMLLAPYIHSYSEHTSTLESPPSEKPKTSSFFSFQC